MGDEPSTQDIKLVQTRLEGCLEAYERDGDCVCRPFDQYDQINTSETIYELAEFFRVFVAVQIEGVDCSY